MISGAAFGWNEPVYIIFDRDGFVFGLTRNKEHAEHVAKEIGGDWLMTNWIKEWS